MIVENPGAIVIAQSEDSRVGLVRNFRMTGKRLFQAGSKYIQRLHDEDLWSEMLACLGTWSWEAPRGLTDDPNEEDLEKFILKTAKVEASEEGGFKLVDMQI